MNSCTEYGFTRDSISTPNKAITTWHRIVEAMKFAYAKRSRLGDGDMESTEFNRTLYEVCKVCQHQEVQSRGYAVALQISREPCMMYVKFAYTKRSRLMVVLLNV